MSLKFLPCSACARHVKQGDSTCPFCGVEVSRVDEQPARITVTGRLSRSALLAVSALGAAVAATDCSPSSSIAPYGTPPHMDDSDAGSAQPVYGAPVPPADAGHD